MRRRTGFCLCASGSPIKLGIRSASLSFILLAVICSDAQAATMARSFDLEASNFSLEYGSGDIRPIDAVTLDFTVTFDPAQTIYPTTQGLDVTYFTLPYNSQYSYDPLSMSTIGTYIGLDSISFAPDSYGAFIGVYPPYVGGSFEYTDADHSTWNAGTVTVSYNDTPLSAVPLPCSISLFATALATVAAAARLRRGSGT